MATQQELIGAICAPCSGLLSTEAALRALASEGGYRHSSLAETRKSAARGCPLCSELVGHWKADKDAPFKDSDTIIFKFYDLTATQMCESQVPTLYPHVSRYLNARRFYGDGYRYVRGTQLFPIVADHADPAAAWIQSRPVMTAVGSEFAFDTTRNWLEACLKDHPVCCRPEPPHLPTRVIDVGTQRHNDGAVRLHISKPAETYAYATLSYCWGGPQPVLLKAANIDEMTREIPLDPLPQTIKDAIRVTRRLGIRFLWIDALCIIQEGDESDKMHEVGVMSEVYGNSTITIMAASAQSVSEGFLHKRAASSTISLPFYCKSGEIGTVQLIRSQLSRHDLMKPLNRRGWAFQEQILSRRMIIYGEKEQVWCCQTEHCKQFPGSTLTPVLDLSSLPPAAFGAERYILSVGEAQNLWEDLVSEYTKRALSLSEDRLAAVTGVIDSLKPLFQDDCAFGIWHKNFLRQVVWHRNYIETNPGDKKWQEVLSCAPEWSWASRTFPVKFQKDFEPCGKGQEHWKVVADNKAVLTGKLKRGHDMTEEDRNGLISATWDILSPELPRTNFVMNYKNNEMFYLLCGYHSSRRPDGLQKDIITLALERRGDGVYRRLGVVFFDMEVTTFDNEVDQEVVLV